MTELPLEDLLSDEDQHRVLRDIEDVLNVDRGSIPNLEVGFARGARYFAELLKRPAPSADALAQALGVRLGEVLPESVDVSVNNAVINLRAKGAAGVDAIGMVALRLPIPRTAQLKLELVMFARDTAEFVAEATGQPWPAPNAEPRVAVDDNEARIAWYEAGSADPILILPAISRSEINL